MNTRHEFNNIKEIKEKHFIDTLKPIIKTLSTEQLNKLEFLVYVELHERLGNND